MAGSAAGAAARLPGGSGAESTKYEGTNSLLWAFRGFYFYFVGLFVGLLVGIFVCMCANFRVLNYLHF